MAELRPPFCLNGNEPSLLIEWYKEQVSHFASRAQNAELECEDLENKLAAFEGKIKSGTLIKREEIANCPEISSIIKENERLKSILRKRRPKNEQPAVAKLTFAELLGSTSSETPPPNARRVQYDRRQSAAVVHIPHTNVQRSTVNTAETRIKFKIINVGNLDLQTIQQSLNADPGNECIRVEEVYVVNAPKSKYNNARFTCSLARAANFESYPYVYIQNQRMKVFESLNIPQCTKCWSYDHTRRLCKNDRRCKSCSSTTCQDSTNCISLCWLCTATGNSSHKNGSHVCSALITATNNYKKQVFRGTTQNPLNPLRRSTEQTN